MAAGLSVATANAMLDSFGDVYVQMHTGDPGANGTSNISAHTQRALADLGPAAAGLRSLVSAIDWASVWSATAQTVTHVSGWTAATGGTFVFSAALSSQIDFVPGLRATVTALTVSIPSIASD